MEVEPTAGAAAGPLEQALIEALLALSWPLPRTVEDADSALTRLEEVAAALTLLEQQSVGTEAWWAGQVDGLATQSGFVLEWWRPVLRDPDLDWTLNHQAHLTADLATLASAGARLLDQIEPRAAEEAAEAAHARRVAQEKRWGPAAVPHFAPTGPKPGAPGPRPQPPAEVFGEAAPSAGAYPSNLAQHAPPIPAASAQPDNLAQPAPSVPAGFPVPPVDAAAAEPMPVPVPFPVPSDELDAPSTPMPPPASPALFDQDAPPVAAPPSIPAQGSHAPAPDVEHPLSAAEPISEPQAAAVRPFAPIPVPTPEGSMNSARHRRPAYDFDDPQGSAAPPAAFPQGGPPPRSPIVPGPGFGGPAHHGRVLTPGGPHGAAEYGSGPLGFVGEDEDEPDSLVPTGLGLRRHQRRLLIQTGAIVGAIGVLCWWAVYTVSSPSSSHPSAAGDATHTAGSTGHTVAAGGLSAPHSASPTSSGKPSDSASAPAVVPPPPTATTSVPDATTVSSVRVTLLGGSSAVPQIAVLISVDTAGTGAVTVTGSYYGASGSNRVAAETEEWTLSGQTSYQYSVPVANSDYCGTQFHFTVSAGGHSDAEETAPGC